MKKLFFSLMAAGMLISACGQKGSPAADTTGGGAESAPIMKFVKDTHDFGKIKAGDKVDYDFKFTNAGKTPLIITSAIASCGCTIPQWPKAPIKPGESSNIHVTFDSKAKMGLQDKLITISANTNPAQNYVHLIGEVTLNKTI